MNPADPDALAAQVADHIAVETGLPAGTTVPDPDAGGPLDAYQRHVWVTPLPATYQPTLANPQARARVVLQISAAARTRDGAAQVATDALAALATLPKQLDGLRVVDARVDGRRGARPDPDQPELWVATCDVAVRAHPTD